MNPIIIFTRFSVVNKAFSPTAWKASKNASLHQQLSNLFENQDRLRSRMEIFKLSLKNISFANIDHSAIRHIVVTSSQLPEWAAAELKELSRTYNWLKIISLSIEDEFSIKISTTSEIQKIIEGKYNNTDEVVFCGLRLDDDDILSFKYFEYLKYYNNIQFTNMCVSFPSGYAASWHDRTHVFTRFSLTHQPMIAIGLAYIGSYSQKTRAITSQYIFPPGNHKMVDRTVPTIMDGRFPAYIWSIHEASDSMTDIPAGYIQKQMDKIIDKGDSCSLQDIDNEFVGIPFKYKPTS